MGVHSRHLRLNRFKSSPPSKESKTATKEWKGEFSVLEGSASITSGGSDLQIRGGGGGPPPPGPPLNPPLITQQTPILEFLQEIREL